MRVCKLRRKCKKMMRSNNRRGCRTLGWMRSKYNREWPSRPSRNSLRATIEYNYICLKTTGDIKYQFLRSLIREL